MKVPTYIGPALCKGPLPFGRGFCLVTLSPIVSPSLWFLLWIQRYNHRAAVENQGCQAVTLSANRH